jgi:vacuolar-type H+-ATPase subunit I/STV1
MSVVSTWLAFMGYGIVIFLIGLLWARKEKRDRAKSSSQPRKNESSGHPGTDLVDNDRQP